MLITRDTILDRLNKTGVPLQHGWEIHRGINTGCNQAFVINEGEHQQLIAADSNSEKLIKLAVGKPQKNRWKPKLKYLIWIPSSKFKCWPWSKEKREEEAERIFKTEYPAISDHLHRFKDSIKAKAANDKKDFYWELPWYVNRIEYPEVHGPKIIFYDHPAMGLAAWYDQSCAYVVNTKVFFIPTADFSLLAILNSKLFDWYTQTGTIKTKKIKNFKITGTEEQKLKISHLVQQIVEVPDSLEVSAIEQDIDQLIYELYKLTDEEIALIEEESNP